MITAPIRSKDILYFVDENPHLFADRKTCTDRIYGSVMDGFYEGPNIWWYLAVKLNAMGYSVQHVQSLKDIHTDYAAIIVTNVKLLEMKFLAHNTKKFPAHKLILTLWEPPTVNPDNYNHVFHARFCKILTWCDDLIDNSKYIKFYYPRQQLYMISDTLPFKDKKLCCMVAGLLKSSYPGELYSERLNTVMFFETHASDEFDLFGERGWHDKNLKIYKGCIPQKIETLKHYRFCICYENTRDLNGYITEKIFDCFHVGCVPVYWGARNIQDYVPQNCFIDRRNFATHDDLYSFLKNMSADEYQGYLYAIQDYFAKDSHAELFSVKNFVAIMSRSILNLNR